MVKEQACRFAMLASLVAAPSVAQGFLDHSGCIQVLAKAYAASDELKAAAVALNDGAIAAATSENATSLGPAYQTLESSQSDHLEALEAYMLAASGVCDALK